jgi:hypothetical protein
MVLNPNLIPHEDFHKGLWLQTQKSPWYFFYETPRDYVIPRNKSFYKTVDPNLLDIVKFLHSKNIPTTPSCSGHIKPLLQYGTLFNTIKNVQNDIKNNGIELTNPETNRKFFYKNGNYDLPWNKENFISQMDDYQKKGVLGFVDDDNHYDWISKTIPSKNENGITLIFTKSNNESDLSRNWNSISNILKDKIK